MEILWQAVPRELHTYIDSAASDGLRRDIRVQIAVGFLTHYSIRLDEMEQYVRDVTAELSPLAIPLSYTFDPGRATHIVGMLRALTDVMVRYDLGDVPTSTLIEQAHTTVELLLKTAQPDLQRHSSFQRLVDDAVTRSIITTEHGRAFSSLKSVRKRAKHFGQGVSEAAVEAAMPDVLQGCHRLTAYIRRVPTK